MYHLICKDCKKEYSATSNSSYCPYCKGNKREYQKECKDCGFKWKSNNFSNEKCPKCGQNHRKNFKMNKARKCYLKCKICGKKYISGSAKGQCPYCKEQSNLSDSVKEFNNLIQSGWKDQNNGLIIQNIEKGKLNFKKVCLICKREFNLNYPSQKYCGYCETYKVCKNCNNKYITNNKQNGFCSIRCSNIFRHRKETFFGNNTNLNSYDINMVHPKIYIPEHTKIENLNDYDFCGIWYKYDPENRIVLDVCLTINIKEEIKYHFKQLKLKNINKYLEMSKLNNIEFYYLESFNSWEEGLIKEMNFALKTKAKYWKPAPGLQSHYIKTKI